MCPAYSHIPYYTIQVFELCDTENKGYITRKEISQFCGRRNSALDTVMTSLDADNDGRITFGEFHTSFKVKATTDVWLRFAQLINRTAPFVNL